MSYGEADTAHTDYPIGWSEILYSQNARHHGGWLN